MPKYFISLIISSLLLFRYMFIFIFVLLLFLVISIAFDLVSLYCILFSSAHLCILARSEFAYTSASVGVCVCVWVGVRACACVWSFCWLVQTNLCEGCGPISRFKVWNKSWMSIWREALSTCHEGLTSASGVEVGVLSGQLHVLTSFPLEKKI